MKNKPKINAEYCIFHDYDDTSLYSYTKDEFLTLTSLPKLPSHDGLICQGWNYELEAAKGYVEEYGVLDIGATYITDDGKTRLYITIDAEGRMDVPIRFKQTVAYGVVVDWGDGSETQTFSDTTVYTSHHYEHIGSYVITIDVNDGILNFSGTSSGSIISNSTRAYSNMLRKVEIGNGVTSIGASAFYLCSSVVFYDFSTHEFVPTIASNTFTNIASDCKIIVPDSLYDEWIAASNWSTYASKIVKASEYNG